MKRYKNAITDYWIKNYVSDDGLCMLCGNSGIISIDSVRSPIGELVNKGKNFTYCLCPNGQCLREQSTTT